MRRNKVLQFSAPGLKTPSIPLKNPERVREGKRKQEVKRNSHEHEAVVRVQRKKIQSGQKKDKRFEDEGGVQGLHWQKGARLSNKGIPDEGVRGERHSAGRCRISKKSRQGSSRSESCQEF